MECAWNADLPPSPLDARACRVQSCRRKHPRGERSECSIERTVCDSPFSGPRSIESRVLLLMPLLRCAHVWGTFGRCAGCLLSTSRLLCCEVITSSVL